MRIKKLDGLRGIFSLMIVIFHYKKEYLPEWFYNSSLIRESCLFVDFFFVLSGFVIAYNYNTLSNFKEFFIYIKKRFVRLYPLLFFSSLLMLLYILFSKFVLVRFIPNAFESDINSCGADIKNTLESLLFTNSTPILGTSLGLNYPSWSISSEMISYLVFGFLMVLLSKKLKMILLAFVIITSSLLLFNNGNFFATGDYGFLRGLVCFNLGYFVWELSKLEFKLNNNFEYLIPFLLVVVFYYIHNSNTKSDINLIFAMITIPVFFGLSILTLLKTNGLLSRLIETKLFQYLGKISYSIYLNHPLLLIIIVKPIFRILKIGTSAFNQFMVLFFLILAVITYSHFTYKFIELKGGKFLKNLLLKTR
ncbi:MAG: acyltransferase [Flavobacterium sp.]|nr:acyltransferase [Flavobacterium sp.]